MQIWTRLMAGLCRGEALALMDDGQLAQIHYTGLSVVTNAGRSLSVTIITDLDTLL